jgi:uncharacterized protein YcnI
VKSVVRIAVALTVVLVGLAVATPASAHVTVNPPEATQGEYAGLTFRAPNESDTAATVALEVHFPEESPVPSVSVGQVPGWTAEVTYRTLDTPLEGGEGEQITEVVDFITWTAGSDEAAIQPGEFGEFPISAGPMPEVDQVMFPTLQTYSDEQVVRWIDPPEEGREPENPAPVLTLLPAGDPGDETAAPAPAAQQSTGSEDGGSDVGVWLGLAGLVAGLAGLALGGAAFARTRSRAEVSP